MVAQLTTAQRTIIIIIIITDVRLYAFGMPFSPRTDDTHHSHAHRDNRARHAVPGPLPSPTLTCLIPSLITPHITPQCRLSHTSHITHHTCHIPHLTPHAGQDASANGCAGAVFTRRHGSIQGMPASHTCVDINHDSCSSRAPSLYCCEWWRMWRVSWTAAAAPSWMLFCATRSMRRQPFRNISRRDIGCEGRI